MSGGIEIFLRLLLSTGSLNAPWADDFDFVGRGGPLMSPVLEAVRFQDSFTILKKQ